MTQEQKELLLKDLCARLPYGVKIMFSYNGFRWYGAQTLEEINQCEDGEYAINGWGIHGIKPYLRPMSSMTEDERSDLRKYCAEHSGITYDIGISGATNSANIINWLLAHYFDIYGLIPMDLAIAVTEENNPYKTL